MSKVQNPYRGVPCSETLRRVQCPLQQRDGKFFVLPKTPSSGLALEQEAYDLQTCLAREGVRSASGQEVGRHEYGGYSDLDVWHLSFDVACSLLRIGSVLAARAAEKRPPPHACEDIAPRRERVRHVSHCLRPSVAARASRLGYGCCCCIV